MNPIEEARKELSLNNPDYRRVCAMLADAIEGRIIRQEPDLRISVDHEIHARVEKPEPPKNIVLRDSQTIKKKK